MPWSGRWTWKRSYWNRKGKIKIKSQVLRCLRYVSRPARHSLFLKRIDDTGIFGWSGWFSVPQATVRMVINYKKTQKTILRVSPRVPLADHLPAICEKCEFDVESTVLLRDVNSLSALDLSCSLNDYAIREVYARDTKSKSSPLTGQNCQVVLLLIYCLLCRTVGLSCVSSFTESCRYPSLETISRPVPSYSWDFYKFVIFVPVYSVSKQR